MNNPVNITPSHIRFYIERKSTDTIAYRQTVLERIARIIDFDGKLYPSGAIDQYNIGPSNDWWLSVHEFDDNRDEVRISCRYPDLLLMTQLRAVIIYFVGLQGFNFNPLVIQC